jgi:hypothetical protein
MLKTPRLALPKIPLKTQAVADGFCLSSNSSQSSLAEFCEVRGKVTTHLQTKKGPGVSAEAFLQIT